MSDLGNKDVFSKNLKYYMERVGKDRTQVCKELGIKYTTFTDWYNGNKYPRIDKIELLANYFGIQKSDLIENVSHEEKETKTIEELKVALFTGSQNITDEMWEEVVNFARYIEAREAEKNKKDE